MANRKQPTTKVNQAARARDRAISKLTTLQRKQERRTAMERRGH